jgi:hypothetical protein
MPTPSRRAFLKSLGFVGLSSLAAAQPGLSRLPQAQTPPPFPPRWNGQPYGRITNAYQPLRERPTTESDEVGRLQEDEVARIRRTVRGETVFSNSDLWLETDAGYLYASFVQPMWPFPPNKPVAELGRGRWARVTVSYSDAYRHPDPEEEDGFISRLRYGGVVRVTALEMGEDGQAWYHVRELYQNYYMPAAHLRLIPPEHLTPLSSDVDPRDKRIEVDLSEQTLIAYEGDTPVMAHNVSSGIAEHPTPPGVHYVLDKRISERMVGGIDENKYSLPGVPFVCYFTDEWVGTHGCYWHNDWGRPRSHGCLNLPPAVASWLWRWTTPVADLDAMYYRSRNRLDGTQIIVRT